MGTKGAKKKCKDVDYIFFISFFQKYFVVHEQSAVKNSFSTYYVCYAPDGLFLLNLYELNYVSEKKSIKYENKIYFDNIDLMCLQDECI